MITAVANPSREGLPLPQNWHGILESLNDCLGTVVSSTLGKMMEDLIIIIIKWLFGAKILRLQTIGDAILARTFLPVPKLFPSTDSCAGNSKVIWQ